MHRASDVWSLGCILFEMVTNRSPFEQILRTAKNPLVFIDILRRKKFEIDFSLIKSSAVRQLAERMLDSDDSQRISLDQVLNFLRQM